jgi:aryl-alcohol dehydrogenase (NADP+)
MEAYEARNANERTWRITDAVAAVAEARGVSRAEVALAWVRDRPAVTSVILGARTPAQLAENLRAAGLVLEPSETASLDAASAPEAGVYPYGPQAIAQRHRNIEGGR